MLNWITRPCANIIWGNDEYYYPLDVYSKPCLIGVLIRSIFRGKNCTSWLNNEGHAFIRIVTTS